MKKITILLMLTLILLPTVIAQEDFNAKAASLFSLEKCISEENIIQLTNTGTQTSNYQLYGQGKTSDWVKYPQMFSLSPGKTINVKSLLTIPCTAQQGNYPIKTIISTTTGIEKEIIQDIIIQPTINIEASVKEQTKTIKPCSQAIYEINIKNPSSFQETYNINTDNPDLNLKETKITLEPGKERQITAEYQPKDCKDITPKKFLITINTEKTKLIADLELFLEIEDYGIAEIAPKVEKIRTYYNENIVDLEITNKGKETVNYIMDLEGLDWVTITPRLLSIPSEETKTITLNLAPEETTKKGKYPLTIVAETEETGAKYEKEIIVKLTTHGVIDNLFDKYLPLTVLIIIALVIFGIIAVYSIQYMSTEEYQKQQLKRMKEKEKLKKQKEREKNRKRKEKEILKKERIKEKQRLKQEKEIAKQKIRENREKAKEKKIREKEKAAETRLRLSAKKAKQTEKEIERKQKAEKKINQKYEKALRKKYLMISKEDIITGQKPKNLFSKIIFAIIIIALLVIIAVFIQPIINNIKYVILGVGVLLVLYILGKIRKKKTLTKKWKGLSLAKETKTINTNWRKGVQQIKIKLSEPIKKLKIKITRGRKRKNPKYICIDEHIYQYFRTETNTEDENFDNTEILFKVSKKWIERKKIDSEEIMLCYLENEEWNELETEQIDSDKDYLYYSAESEKTGQFAIIGTEEAEEIEETKSKTKGIIALIGVILIAAIIFILLKPAIQLPTAGIPTQTWLQGEQQSLDLNTYFQDPDEDILEFGIKEEINNIDIWFKDGIAYLTPDADFTGEKTIIFTAEDNKGGYAESNPVKLIIKNKETNWFVKTIKISLGIIILIAILLLIIKLILLIRESISES